MIDICGMPQLVGKVAVLGKCQAAKAALPSPEAEGTWIGCFPENIQSGLPRWELPFRRCKPPAALEPQNLGNYKFLV